MSFVTDVDPIFFFTNNAQFTIPGSQVSYLPANDLDSLFPNEAEYDTATGKIHSESCFCNFDFLATASVKSGTNMYNRITDENSVTAYGRNTAQRAGDQGRLEDNVSHQGSILELSFNRDSNSSSGTVTVATNQAFFAGVSLNE